MYTANEDAILIKTLIKFIERKTPMPIEEYVEAEKYKDFTDYHAICPLCRAKIEWEKQNYCRKCGQHLKWTDISKMRLIHKPEVYSKVGKVEN